MKTRMKTVILFVVLAACAAAFGRARDASADPVRKLSFGGDVRLSGAADGADVCSFGGGVRVDGASRSVRVCSFGGSVNLADLSSDAHVTSFGGEVDVAVTDGARRPDRRVSVRSYGGEVTVRVPDGVTPRIVVEVVNSENDRREDAIESDFPLVRPAPTVSRSFFTMFHRMRTERAYSAPGADGPRIVVHSDGGNVRIVRERV